MEVIPYLKDHAEPLISAGRASWCAEGWDELLDTYYYKKQQWKNNRIDWSSSGRKFDSIDLYISNEEDIRLCFSNTALSDYEIIILCFDVRMPYLKMAKDDFVDSPLKCLMPPGDALGCGVQSGNR